MTPNARTKKLYEDLGFMCSIVERWSPFPKPFGKKHDLFGIFDLIALKPGGKIIGIQATSTPHMSDRITKVTSSKEYHRWKDLGGEVEVVGWAKRGPRGKRKMWTSKVEIL